MTLITDDYRVAKAWSLLDSRPVFCYNKHTTYWMCYWNGVVLPADHAFSVVMTRQLNCYLTPQINEALINTFIQSYHMGLFYEETDTYKILVSECDSINAVSYYRSALYNHIKTLESKFTVQDMVLWFEPWLTRNLDNLKEGVT